jgi:DNA helicase-2/ATP-dependent DNA helicase PcrA
MVGGVAFFARREVKDLLAYLRVAANPNDRVAFWRVWNTPRRGLGDAVRARIEARGAEAPLEALRALAVEGLKGAARGGAESFLGLVDELRARLAEPPAALLRRVIDRTGYLETLDPESDERATDRRANLEELLAAAEEYAARGPGEDRSDLVAGFLAEATLVTDADRIEEGADRVLLLTAHTAKGLEFPLVIATGLEEGLWPHAQSANEAKELEEERRLFYVALTRARDQVLLTAAAYRRRFTPDGSFVARGGAVSRFVDEIPAELMDREETAAQSARTASSTEYARRSWNNAGRGAGSSRWGHRPPDEVADGPAFRTTGKLTRTVGKEVFHETFGRGVVVMAEGEGAEVRFTVRFGTQLKKVMGRFLTGGVDVD